MAFGAAFILCCFFGATFASPVQRFHATIRSTPPGGTAALRPAPPAPNPAVGGNSALPASPTANASSAPAPDPSSADVLELQRSRDEFGKIYQALNQTNPMSGQFNPSAAGIPTGVPPQLHQAIEQFRKLLEYPVVKETLKIYSNPKFQEGIRQITASPQRMNLLYAEIALVLILIIYRTWRYSKVRHWALRIWTRLYTLVIFWVLAIAVVPCLVLGQGYQNLCYGIIQEAERAYHAHHE